jgi:hypothetical protein
MATTLLERSAETLKSRSHEEPSAVEVPRATQDWNAVDVLMAIYLADLLEIVRRERAHVRCGCGLVDLRGARESD